jgi:hypothetical protein
MVAAGMLTVPAGSPAAEDKLAIGTGCFYDLVSMADRVARECHAGQDPAMAAALADSVVRLDRMFLEKGYKPADVEKAKLRQRQENPGSACSPDADQLYQLMLSRGAEKLRGDTETIATRPGKPTYGDCF